MDPICKTWFSLGEKTSKKTQALAWTSSKIQLHVCPEQWKKLRLSLNDSDLPLSLHQQAGEVKLMSEWPASEPGYYQLSLFSDQDCLYQQEVFVGTRHLSAQDWISLLQDLRYQWPKESVRLKPPSQTPVRPQPGLSALEEEEIFCLQHILEGDSQHKGVFAALLSLERSVLKRPHIKEAITPLCRIRSLDPKLLYRDLRQFNPEHRVMQSSVKNDSDLPENRFVAFVAYWLLQHLSELQAYLRARGESYWLEKLSRWLRQLLFLWSKNELAVLKPMPEPPRNPDVFLHRDDYYSFYHVWQLMDLGHVPYLAGQRKFAYQKFALLYQNWCLFQLARLLLQWAHEQHWAVLEQNMRVRRGKALMVLQDPCKNACLHLIPEYSYGFQGAIYSATRMQRPDISLLYQDKHLTELIVFECKFRAEDQQPIKEDLDRLHAYRDAIRRADGSAVVDYAVLLYPGLKVTYPSLLAAWQAHPGKPLDWDVTALLKKFLSLEPSL